MNEWTLVWQAVPKLLLLTSFMLAYVAGGRAHKWIRRWVGAAIFIVGMITMSVYERSFSWPFAVSCFGIIVGLNMGYGADSLFSKMSRRILYGGTLGVAAVLIAWTQGVIVLGFFQAFLTITTNVFLGVFNPTKSAVDEEAIIATASILTIPFMV